MSNNPSILFPADPLSHNLKVHQLPGTTVKAIVVGAGLAGIAATQALRRAGIETSLYERDQEFRRSGYAIILHANGAYALDQLDLLDEVLDANVGSAIVGMEVWDGYKDRSLGKVLLPIAALPSRFRPFCCLRWKLQEAMLRGLLGEPPILGRKVTAVRQVHNLTVAEFDDGSCEEADIVVGADGINSKVREVIAPGVRPRTGLSGVIANVPHPPDSNDAGVFEEIRDKGCLNIIATSRGETIYAPNDVESVIYHQLYAGTAADEPTTSYRQFCERQAAMINDSRFATIRKHTPWTPDAAHEGPFEWAVTQLPILESYCSSNVVLVGDSAHGMYPTAGMGANLAIEDAMILGRILRDKSANAAQSLHRFNQERKAVIRPIQNRVLAQGFVDSWWKYQALKLSIRFAERAINKQYESSLRYAIEDSACDIAAPLY